MNRPPKRKPWDAVAFFSAVIHSELNSEKEIWLYLLFSVADVVLTIKLLMLGGHYTFMEGNPVARFFLNHWGPRGMVYFKFTLVALVCLLAEIIAVYRIETARKLLSFAVLAVACVCAYSAALYYRAAF